MGLAFLTSTELQIKSAHLNSIVTRTVARDVVAIAIGLYGAAADTRTLLWLSLLVEVLKSRKTSHTGALQTVPISPRGSKAFAEEASARETRAISRPIVKLVID